MSTWTDTVNYIKTQLRPGVLGITDVQKILNSVLAVINQINAGDIDPQNESLWKADVVYPADTVPVIWQDTWLVSNVNNNEGNVPINASGVVHPTWRVIGSSVGSGIREWEAIVYPNVLELVFFDGGLYYLNRDEVGNDPFVSVDFEAELIEEYWVSLSGSGGGDIPQNILNALNAATGPSESNPFATIADLPEFSLGNRILEAGTLVINSGTSATLTGLKWVWDNQIKEFSGNLTLQAKPTDPDNRFDIVTVSGANTPAVEEGQEAEDPPVPAPDDPTHLVAQTIYRPHTAPDQVTPTPPPTVYSTKNVSGQYERYAPIWQHSLNPNTYYDFKIGYIGWSSNYTTDRQRPQNGFVTVNFVTQATSGEVDPNRINIRTIGMRDEKADFVLVQTGASQVTLFTKKTGFFQTLFFEFVGGKSGTVSNNSLINQGDYAVLPSGDSWESEPAGGGGGLEVVDPFTATLRFDKNYKSQVSQTGAIAFTRNNVNLEYSNRYEVFVEANGTGGKPTFSADFVVHFDSWSNNTGDINHIVFKASPTGKVLVWMVNVELA